MAGGAGERRLRDAFETVLVEQVIPAYFEEGSEMRGARGLSIIENMLRGNVVPFAVQYERRGQQKGLEEGREEGLEEGREEIRGLDVRMARARFGGRVSERLTALLRPVRSLGLLGQIGDVVVAAETGEELLARVADLALAEPGRRRLPGVDGQPGDAGAAALRGMLEETSARLRWVLAISDQGLGSFAVGAARELDGPCPPRPARTVTLVLSSGANNVTMSSLSSAEIIWVARRPFEGSGATGERPLAPTRRVYPKLPSLRPAVANHKQSDNSPPLFPTEIM